MQALSQLSYGPTGLESRQFWGQKSDASSTNFDIGVIDLMEGRHAMPLLG